MSKRNVFFADIWRPLQVFADWAEQRIRVAEGSRSLELSWTVGPVPIADGKGKEVTRPLSTR